MIIVGGMLKGGGQCANVRMTGQSKILLDEIFKNDSIINFLELKEKDNNKFKDAIYKKIKDVGVDIFVSFIIEGFKEVYKKTSFGIIN